MRPPPSRRAVSGLVVSVAAALLGSCSGSVGDAGDIEDPTSDAIVTSVTGDDGVETPVDDAEPSTSAPPSSAPPTTRSVPTLPPTLDVDGRLVAEIGAQSSFSVTAAAADGDDVEVRVQGLPDGAELDGTTIVWRPSAPGSWDVTVTAAARDDGGDVIVEETVEMAARWPRRDDLVVAVGDSVAAGHGLDAWDFLGLDACFRAEELGYPRHVADGLAARGLLPAAPAVGVVACTGADAPEVLGSPVRASIPGLDVAGPLSQLDWAVRSNPAYVVLTVGANDARFTEPAELVGDDGLDLAGLRARLDGLGDDLDTILDRLVSETDARIVVTTYHNPVGDDPNGVDGCAGTCFVDAVTTAVDEVATTISSAAAHQPADRVSVADLSEAFAGHGAGRRLGADLLSQQGEGAIADLVADLADLTDPYCSASETSNETWISIVDCVHPDSTGAAVYGAAVLEALGG